jgi:hypothetical protein
MLGEWGYRREARHAGTTYSLWAVRTDRRDHVISYQGAPFLSPEWTAGLMERLLARRPHSLRVLVVWLDESREPSRRIWLSEAHESIEDAKRARDDLRQRISQGIWQPPDAD